MATAKKTLKKTVRSAKKPAAKKPAKPEKVDPSWSAKALRALGEKIFRPTWPRLEEVREAVEGITDPLEAWEALGAKDLLPLSWIGDTKRVFTVAQACKECEEEGEGNCDGLPHRLGCPRAGIPPSMNVVVTLAAAGNELQRAEALALEVVGRLGPWRTEELPSAIAWRVRSPPRLRYLGRPGDEALAHLSGRLRNAANTSAYTNLVRSLSWKKEPTWITERYQIAHAAAIDYERMLRFAQRKNEERPNPFEPLLELWSTGFMLESLSGGLVVLLSIDVTQPPSV